MPEKIKKVQTPMFYRTLEIDRARASKENRTIEVSFSSEEPYERYFGTEILDHGPGMDLSFVNSGRAPLLKDHLRDGQTGIIEKAWIEGRRGRAVARFGSSEIAKQEFQDVLDGIRTNVSVGYQIKKMILEEETEDSEVYRVTEWKPLEVSIVSIPADETVGIGRERAAEKIYPTEIIYQNRSIKIMENENLTTSDTKEIFSIGRSFGFLNEASKWIEDGKSLEGFRTYAMERINAEREASDALNTVTVYRPLGLNQRELNQFSFLKIANAIGNPTDKKIQESAAFELEVSAAARKASDRSHHGSVTIPFEVLSHSNRPEFARDMQVGVDPQGGYLVPTTLLMGSFIEFLDAAMMTAVLGATIIRGLEGDVAFPSQTSRSTAYWVSEKDDITESQAALGQVALKPKTVGAFTDLTRRLMIQTGGGAEMIVKNDLATSLALAIDLAAIAGEGTPNRPQGILETEGIGTVTLTTADTPTFAEVVDMKKEVAIDNALVGSLGYLTNATIAGNMEKTNKETGYPIYILEDGKVAGKKCEVSNQVPAGKIIFGDWSSLLIGYWAGLDLNVDTSTLSKSGGTRIVTFQDIDVALRHPESFCVGAAA